MNKKTRYSPEIRERAVRLVFEQQASHKGDGVEADFVVGYQDYS